MTALIFVGLAVAWAAYLIPKALEHHNASADSRNVDKFSDKLRVLARREAVGSRTTALVTSRRGSAAPAEATPSETAAPAAPASGAPAEPPTAAPAAAAASSGSAPSGLGPTADPEQTGFFAAQTFVRRSATSRAARRRRRVLGGLLVLLAMVGTVAVGQVISWWWIALPVALLAGWLVACRKMVVRERAALRRPVRRVAPTSAPSAPAADAATLGDETAEVPVVRAEVAEPIASGDGWELVPVTLPTYVSKPAARRAVSTIDLDSTGVWTSGHTAADSALAQQADAARAAGKQAVQADGSQRRASGA